MFHSSKHLFPSSLRSTLWKDIRSPCTRITRKPKIEEKRKGSTGINPGRFSNRLILSSYVQSLFLPSYFIQFSPSLPLSLPKILCSLCLLCRSHAPLATRWEKSLSLPRALSIHLSPSLPLSLQLSPLPHSCSCCSSEDLIMIPLRNAAMAVLPWSRSGLPQESLPPPPGLHRKPWR